MCSYFSWRIVQSCHPQCGYGQGLQRSQSTYHWKRSGQIFLVTPQVHCYHFMPSPAVTAPRSSVHIEKKTAWKVFTEHFALLSAVGEGVFDSFTISSAEKFVCRMYNTSEESLDFARVVLFSKVDNPEKLPPTSDAFRQHLKRCHYQTAVWRQAHIQKPVLTNPKETGWTLAGDQLVPVLMTLDPIPEACLELASCRCTTGRATLRCKCRKSHVVCTGQCGCNKVDANCCVNPRR